jgi:hypothetical protein
MFSLYKTVESYKPDTIDLTNYISFVKLGTEQDLVIEGRKAKQEGNIELYKSIKLKARCITGSCIMNEGSKSNSNIKQLNNLIVIDIDTDVSDNLIFSLQQDQYTHVLHRSFGGDGVCIFVKINSELFKESFNQLAQYYFEKYGLVIDQACKNKNRLRFLSYDPCIFYNEKSLKFKAKKEKEKELNIPKITFRGDDFDNILRQIKDKHIDLIKGDYSRFVQIGFALFSKFGDAGKDHFEFINSYNPRYKPQNLDKDWKGFRSFGAVTIATFYYYCKEEGIQLYTNETKQIINAVKVAKINKITNNNDVLKNIKDVYGFEADADYVNELMSSDIDYSIGINSELTEIEVLTNYINDVFEPFYDTLTGSLYIKNWVAVTDVQENDIYISVRKNLNDKIKLADIRAVLCSSEIKKVNVLHDFLNDNQGEVKGVIDEYIDCILPNNEYNRWAFKKWIVGAVHNWTADYNEKVVCPLTLVLSGQQQGTGKTSFLRNILPKELQKYSVEGKINGSDKDSLSLLCSNLMVCDDEFGGKAFKDVKEYKAIADSNIITHRLAYRRNSQNYKRRAILCGTTNELDILKDITGNRRILPITVEKTNYEKMLSINKTDLIIEAYNLLKSGFEWNIQKLEDIEYLDLNTKHNQSVLPFEEIFFNTFTLKRVSEWQQCNIWNQGELLELFNQKLFVKPTKYDLKEVLTKNKLIYKNHKLADGTQKKGIELYSNID